MPTDTPCGVACKIRRFQPNAFNVGIRAAHPQPLHVWGELRRTRRVTRVTEFHKHCKHTLWLLYCHIYYTKLKDAESLRKQLS